MKRSLIALAGAAALLLVAACEDIESAEEPATLDPRGVEDAREAAAVRTTPTSAGTTRGQTGQASPRPTPETDADDPTSAAGSRTGGDLADPGDDEASATAGDVLGSERDTDVTDEGEETDIGGRGQAGRRGGDAAGNGADFG